MARKIKHTAYFWSRYGEQREKGYDHEDALAIAATIEDRHNAKVRREIAEVQTWLGSGRRRVSQRVCADVVAGRLARAFSS